MRGRCIALMLVGNVACYHDDTRKACTFLCLYPTTETLDKVVRHNNNRSFGNSGCRSIGTIALSRPRVIGHDQILDAAEQVILRDGAAKLSLGAVAAEAGISKASVIYDYKTKNALIRAIIERRACAEQARLRAAADALGNQPNALIRGRIAVVESGMEDDARAVGVSLCSAMAQDAAMRTTMQNMVREDLQALMDEAQHPRSAQIAFLASEGLRALETLGLHSWPPQERSAILREIEALVDLPIPVPAGAAQHHSKACAEDARLSSISERKNPTRRTP